jgi:hypothetical protein
MKEQNYNNHRQIVWGYYLTTGVPILVLIGISITRLVQSDSGSRDFWIVTLLIGWILLTLLFRSRGFGLKAQDRAIRAEESLRHYLVTGKPVDTRLTLKQLIALRFAPDEELAALTKKAVEGNWSGDAIKKEIRNWRVDDYRV